MVMTLHRLHIAAVLVYVLTLYQSDAETSKSISLGKEISNANFGQHTESLFKNSLTNTLQNMHRKAKYSTRGSSISEKIITNTYSISVPNISDEHLRNIHDFATIVCANSRSNPGDVSKMKFYPCIKKIYHSYQQYLDELTYKAQPHSKVATKLTVKHIPEHLSKVKRHIQSRIGRRLLSVDGTDKPGIVKLANGNCTQNQSRSGATSEMDEAEREYKQFLYFIERKLSKDPQRAMLSLLFLVFVMMAAIKFCGMRPVKNINERPKDYQEDVHYLSVYDVLRMKQPYLPKKLFNWNRKLRWKLRKKKMSGRPRERDLGDAELGAAQEKHGYARVYDF